MAATIAEVAVEAALAPHSDAAPADEHLRRQVSSLTEQLEAERRRSRALQDEVKRIKEHSLESHSRLEAEEEYITNQLMKRMQALKIEKQAIVHAVEREEEFISNTLQKQLSQLTQEKVELEAAVHKSVEEMHRQFVRGVAEKSKLNHEKIMLENQLEAEQECIVNKLQKHVQFFQAERVRMKKEIEKLRAELTARGHDEVVDRIRQSLAPPSRPSSPFPSPRSTPASSPRHGFHPGGVPTGHHSRPSSAASSGSERSVSRALPGLGAALHVATAHPPLQQQQ